MAVVDKLSVAVVGCGAVGTRRAERVAAHARSRLALAVDVREEPARRTAERFGCAWATHWQRALDDSTIDAIVVSTPNAFLADIAIAALAAGKHVLIEKPMGRNLTEARAIDDAARAAIGVLKVGFNHRYYPGIERAHACFTAGAIGEPISLRVRYGHGGRPGYEREWRSDVQLAGGGELTDQGVHVADLANWFLGLPAQAFAYLQTAIWPIAPLEDNAFGLLRYPNGCVASLHTSWTQWKNLFSFELFGREGALTVEGRGGSYGPQHLVVHRRSFHGGAPETTQTAFDAPDVSWTLEWNDFVNAACERTPYHGTPDDGIAAMRVLHALYESSRANIPVNL